MNMMKTHFFESRGPKGEVALLTRSFDLMYLRKA